MYKALRINPLPSVPGPGLRRERVHPRHHRELRAYDRRGHRHRPRQEGRQQGEPPRQLAQREQRVLPVGRVLPKVCGQENCLCLVLKPCESFVVYYHTYYIPFLLFLR